MYKLKVKDNVSFEELEVFGFKKHEKYCPEDKIKYEQMMYSCSFVIHDDNNIVYNNSIDAEMDYAENDILILLFNLINYGLVEKVNVDVKRKEEK